MKQTKNNVTELVFILDRSGSMAGLEDDTVGGFNALIEQQKGQEGECFVSTILFNGSTSVLHDRVRLAEVEKLTRADYCVGGCTALADALGEAIRHVKNIHKYARREDVPEHTMFVVTTDGQENASRHHTPQTVRKMIEHQKEKHGWEFLFIGANIDAIETASRYGISHDRAVNYRADEEGTRILYETVSETVCDFRMCAPLTADWSKDIRLDCEKRSGR